MMSGVAAICLKGGKLRLRYTDFTFSEYVNARREDADALRAYCEYQCAGGPVAPEPDAFPLISYVQANLP